MNLELAKSLAGHDKGKIYLILEKEEGVAYLVDGKAHTIQRPKKKNARHYQVIKNIPVDILVRLQGKGPLTDAAIYQAVRAYERSINK